MNRFFFLLCLMVAPGVVHALPVDLETAQQKAMDFLSKHSRTGKGTAELRFASRSTYLFETAEAFALVAADDGLPEILGYGKKNGDEMPPALLHYLKAQKYPVAQKERERIKPVPPLLPFVRHQNKPYNNQCPLYKDPTGAITSYRCLTGCVATALEEIISYYRRTVVLQDTLKGWKSDLHSDIPDVLPGTRVDCRLIRNNYDIDDYTAEEADAVQRLTYYCGVAAKMKWGLEASAANVQNLVVPLKQAFGYGYVEYVDSYQYRPADWTAMLRNELYAQRPVYYTGSVMQTGGHAFVLDGLDENGLFHVNWGYGGSYDGYFHLDILNFYEPSDALTPEGKDTGFFINHRALLLHPDSVEVQLPDTLARTGLEIAVDSITFDFPPETDKRTPMQVYLRNTTDQWLTSPFEFFTNAEQDTAIFEQGDYLALGQATLAPFEQKRYTIRAEFDTAGDRILRVSPDDVHCLYADTLHIDEGAAPQLTFHEPEICFPETGVTHVTLQVSNAATAGRSGQEVLFEIGPGDAQTMKDGTRHPRQLYVLPGATQTDTVSFRGLIPGEVYTLLVRSPWTIQAQRTFVVPTASGIEAVADSEQQGRTLWYTLSGTPLLYPKQKGIYIRKKNHKIEKVYIRSSH